MVRAAASPAAPVQAFATRAFIATARIRPGRSPSRSASYSTGAARTAFFVNTPAVAQLALLTSNATSGAPSGLSPACAAAAVKPCGEVTEPSGSGTRVGVIAGSASSRVKISRGRRLCNRPGRRIIAQPSREARSMSEPFLSSDDYDERAHQLYNEAQYDEALETLRVGLGLYPHAIELHVGMGYARLAREEYVWARRAFDEGVALYWLRRALELDLEHAEARVYLANLLYDRGEYEAALFHLERSTPADHFDGLAIWRLIELKKSVYRLPDDDPELVPWHHRLDELAADAGPEDLLLAEIEAMGPDGQMRDPRQLELFGTLLTELQGMKARSGPGDVHRVSMLNGATYVGTWEEIVRQMKDDAAEWARGSLEQYMAAVAHRGRKETGVAIPATDPESFIRGSADAGLLRILH